MGTPYMLITRVIGIEQKEFDEVKRLLGIAEDTLEGKINDIIDVVNTQKEFRLEGPKRTNSGQSYKVYHNDKPVIMIYPRR